MKGGTEISLNGILKEVYLNHMHMPMLILHLVHKSLNDTIVEIVSFLFS